MSKLGLMSADVSGWISPEYGGGGGGGGYISYFDGGGGGGGGNVDDLEPIHAIGYTDSVTLARIAAEQAAAAQAAAQQQQTTQTQTQTQTQQQQQTQQQTPVNYLPLIIGATALVVILLKK
jgi:hypothetical protein